MWQIKLPSRHMKIQFIVLCVCMLVWVSCSKVQARDAFATYLTCIQQRLVAETRDKADADLDTANEQMVCILLSLSPVVLIKTRLHQVQLTLKVGLLTHFPKLLLADVSHYPPLSYNAAKLSQGYS